MNVEIEYPEDFALQGETRMRFDQGIKKMLKRGRRLDVEALDCYCAKVGLDIVAGTTSHERGTLDVLSAAAMRDSPKAMQHSFLYWLGTYLGVCIRQTDDAPVLRAHRVLDDLMDWREWKMWTAIAFVGMLGAIGVMAYDGWLYRTEMPSDTAHPTRSQW